MGEQQDAQLLREAAELATILSSPGNAAVVQPVQTRLQELQKSPAGWTIADSLLAAENANVRFYGALTLTLKINQEWNNLGPQNTQDLLVRLIDYFVLLVSRFETPVVMRKFVVCMTTFFFKPRAPWTYCVRHVASSLANGKYLPEDHLDSETFQRLVLPSLNYDRLLAVVSFSRTLAEESMRHGSISANFNDRLVANLNDAFFLVQYAFQRIMNNALTPETAISSENAGYTAQEALLSLHAWMSALRSIRIERSVLSAAADGPLSYAIRFLAEPTIAGSAMELLADIMANQSKTMSSEHVSQISNFLVNETGERLAMAILKGEFDDDHLRYLDLLIKFASLENQISILTEPVEGNRERILLLLFSLFHAPGFPAVEDQAINILLEFWTEAADNVNDLMIEAEYDEPTPSMKQNFTRAITECFDKLRYPSTSVLKEWEDDDIKLFNAFRRDFRDFLLATYPLLGVPLIQLIQDRAAAAIREQDWERFEVAMFCLSGLAESVAENKHADDLLHTFFQSELFASICYGRIEIPSRSRQTLFDVISGYTLYFERNHNLLPPVLNFLFSSLDTPNSDQAAKAISSLCGTCRQFLTMYVEDFIGKYAQIHSNPRTNSHTLERVAEGIASVIQALQCELSQATMLVKMLDPLCLEAEQARELARNGKQEAGLALGLKVIGCTASIGKGLRAPDEIIVDLDGSESSTPTDKDNFWMHDPRGTSVQGYIIRILDCLMNDFSVDGDIIEGFCDIFKAGYTEKSPGPYVLPPQATARFVKAVSIGSSRFTMVMKTASAFLASHSTNPSQIHNEVVELILHCYNIMVRMVQNPPEYDPEVAYSCVDFLSYLLPKYNQIFFSLSGTHHPDVIEAILQFTIITLDGPETLPLRAACAFWATLLALPNLPPEFVPNSHIKQQKTNANGLKSFDACLARLGGVVMQQIAGRCARSDLDHFSDIIKRLIFHFQGAARVHFGNALASLSVNDDGTADRGTMDQTDDQPRQAGPTSAERERFLSSTLALRGSRATNNLVREFWISCRGRGFAYV